MSFSQFLVEPASQSSRAVAIPHFSVEAENPTLSRLVDIFQKVRGGVELCAEERGLLTSSTQFKPSIMEWLSSFVFTPADSASVREINALAIRILNREISSAMLLDQVGQKLVSNRNPSAKEVAHLSLLINSCLSREESFVEVLENFKKQSGKDSITRGELIDLVTNFNREALPKKSLAGSNICLVPVIREEEDIRDVEIRYNQEGYLEIIDGPIAPLEMSCRQTLTVAQQTEVKLLYNKLTDNLYYNNLGELLEFVRYFKEEQTIYSDLTLQDAYVSYHPDLGAIFDKYQSGACILLATKFCQELGKRGILAQCIGRDGLNNWSSLPIPAETGRDRIQWPEFSREIKGVAHTSVICLFKDEDGKECMLKFECSVEKNQPKEIEEFFGNGERSGLQEFLLEQRISDSEQLPNRIIDIGEIGKRRLKGRSKAIMTKDKMSLGIDFLKGNIYINQSWAKTMSGLPLNAEGMVSIEIQDLAEPNQVGTYFIDGIETSLSHLDALRIVLGKVSSHMSVPADTEENLIALAQVSTVLFDDFFISPLSIIKEHHHDLIELSKTMKQLKAEAEADDSPVEFYRRVQSLAKEYDTLIRAFCDSCNPEEIREKVKHFKLMLASTA
ncbi:MAG: hypothetical protein KGZ39_00750 [Simkania sp.]|nr:hypothetical protein [Simkania sp.]